MKENLTTSLYTWSLKSNQRMLAENSSDRNYYLFVKELFSIAESQRIPVLQEKYLSYFKEYPDKVILDELITKLNGILLRENVEYKTSAFAFLDEKHLLKAYLENYNTTQGIFLLLFKFITLNFSNKVILNPREKYAIQNKNAPYSRFSITFLLMTFLRNIGELAYQHLIENLGLTPNQKFKYRNINDKRLNKIILALGKYLINVYQELAPSIQVKKISRGYIIDFSVFYSTVCHPAPASTFIKNLSKKPIRFLPRFHLADLFSVPSELIGLENQRWKKSNGIQNKLPGKGVRIMEVRSNDYFSTLNLMNEAELKINAAVRDYLEFTIVKHAELNESDQQIWNLINPKPRPRVKLEIKYLKATTGKTCKYIKKTFFQNSFYMYEAELQRTIILLSSILQKINKSFMYSYYFDSRGRIYTTAEGLSPYQGDLSRGILSMPYFISLKNGSAEFNEYCYELKLYAKNFYVEETYYKSNNEIVQWFESLNVDELIESELNNAGWTHKKTPFQYLAWLLEIKKWQSFLESAKEDTKNERTLETNFLAFFDASASGLQLLALLAFRREINDESIELLCLLNLFIPSFYENKDLDELPLNDLYSQLILKFLESLKAEVQNFTAHQLYLFNIICNLPWHVLRKIAKKYLMKMSYLASIRTSVKDLLKILETQQVFDIKLTFKEKYNISYWFIQKFKIFLNKTYMKNIFSFITQFINTWHSSLAYLKTQAFIIINSIPFRNDLYLRSIIDYRPMKKHRVRLSLFKRKKFIDLVTYKPDDTMIFNSKTKSSIIAHLIHSLDSSVLATAIAVSQYGDSFKAVVHDCVGNSILSRKANNDCFLKGYNKVFLGESFNEKGVVTVKDCFNGLFGVYLNDYLRTKKKLTKTEKEHLIFIEYYINGEFEKTLKPLLDGLKGRARILI